MNISLSNLPKIKKSSKKRIGRGLGSGKGAKSGRGTTRHQKARESIPLHFEGGQARLVKKFPLLRGKDKNKSFVKKPIIISFKQLQSFKNGEKVTIDSLIEKGIVNKLARETGVKLLNNGKLDKKLIILLSVSKGAKTAIEKAGGKIEPIN